MLKVWNVKNSQHDSNFSSLIMEKICYEDCYCAGRAWRAPRGLGPTLRSVVSLREPAAPRGGHPNIPAFLHFSRQCLILCFSSQCSPLPSSLPFCHFARVLYLPFSLAFRFLQQVLWFVQRPPPNQNPSPFAANQPITHTVQVIIFRTLVIFFSHSLHHRFFLCS